MASNWALQNADAEVGRLQAEVERLRAAAGNVVEIYRGLADDANDGEFALWSETDLINAIVKLDAALSSAAEVVSE